ncbi:family 20 glycosylhydrolase [Nocardia seriolae]|uniref:beta-N-acetylhexosaminidase n=1 Tax=Nocardia seriolae TaxID=37332 RepID=A0ABC9Z5K1_9NOCA|nr:family 20 glycosylhydrolase [Nocardia seriolae]BEK99073.1 hypothetical protein NSER024013_69790 [Nocardia seriolae]GAM50959.1 hypothetical protein NS07_v2contig00189-0008 [Nocardia seriolae]GAP32904.1 hypothetical protein NSK11_contig00190-0008 [Nocardia seriolae]
MAQQLPATASSIEHWTPETDNTGFTLRADSRIVAAGAYRKTAQLLASDLDRAGKPISAVTDRDLPGDIVLRHGGTDTPESYRIDTSDRLTITAEDRPDHTERDLMLDTGREFFPVDWVKARIRDAAYLRMNPVQLHLSDSQGFRLDSTRHPEITSPEHYSAEDLREILDYADSYGIEIVPEIDMPSHMNAILAGHPDRAFHQRAPAARIRSVPAAWLHGLPLVRRPDGTDSRTDRLSVANSPGGHGPAVVGGHRRDRVSGLRRPHGVRSARTGYGRLALIRNAGLRSRTWCPAARSSRRSRNRWRG